MYRGVWKFTIVFFMILIFKINDLVEDVNKLPRRVEVIGSKKRLKLESELGLKTCFSLGSYIVHSFIRKARKREQVFLFFSKKFDILKHHDF